MLMSGKFPAYTCAVAFMVTASCQWRCCSVTWPTTRTVYRRSRCSATPACSTCPTTSTATSSTTASTASRPCSPTMTSSSLTLR